MIKRLLLSAVAVGFIATNAMAIYVDGTIVGVNNTEGTVIVSISRSSDGVIYHRNIEGTLSVDVKKELYASALTAYTSGSRVIGTGPGGNWTGFRLVNY